MTEPLYFPGALDQVCQMDALELLKALPSDCVDAVITSPPYDNLRTYNGFTWDFESIARETYRVIKPGGVVVWVVGDATINGSETLTSMRQAIYFVDTCGFRMHDTMIYEVAGTGAKGSIYAYWQAWEYMFVLVKGDIKTVNRIADHPNKTAGNKVNRGRKTLINGTRFGEYVTQEYSVRTNIWRYHAGNNGEETTDHPAPFPEKLAEDHILSWTNPGDLVLDYFGGSGTTAKMARKNGRRFLTCDISAEYCDLMKRRLAQPHTLSFMNILDSVDKDAAA